MDEISKIFQKMSHHQRLVNHFTKIKDNRQACHHRTWVTVLDMQLQTLFFGKAEVPTRNRTNL